MDTERDLQRFLVQNNGKLNPEMNQGFSGEVQDQDEERLDIGWVFAVFRRRLPIMLFVILTLTGALGSLIVLKSRQVIPKYQGAFQLLIEPVTVEGQFAQKYLSAQAGGVDINRIQVNNSLVDYESLIRVLKSPSLMEPVVEEIKQRYPNLSSRSFLSSLEISRIMYEKDSKEEGTKLIKVSYQDSDPEKIQFILDQISEAYLNYSLQERLTSINQGLEFINKQLPMLEARYNNLQKQIKIFRQEANLINPDNKDRELAIAARNLQEQIVNNQSELAEKRVWAEVLQQQYAQGNYAEILGNDTGSYSWLIKQYYDTEAEIIQESKRLREDSLPMQLLREKRQKMQSLLQQEAQKVIDSTLGRIEALEARVNVLQEAQNQLNQRIQELPALANREAELQQQLLVASETLTEFLEKREALGIDAAQQQIPWHLVSPPSVSIDDSGKPISITVSSTKRQLAIAVVLSTLLGIGIGFIIDVLITVFHTPDEIKSNTKLPVLGVIPLSKHFKKVAQKSKTFIPIGSVASLTPVVDRHSAPVNPQVHQYYTASPVSEAFRSLYANICLLSSNKPLRSITISSATPGDGKSTIAIHLAQTAAFMGQRVLLVDADLRNPQIHHKLGLPNLRGFRDAITSDLSLNDAIQRFSFRDAMRSPQDDNLFVLTAGQIPPDPVQVLSAKKRQYLMEQFRAFFDLVIYDTPAVTGLADASLIAAQTDGIILVVGIKKTNRSALLKSLEGLNLSNSVLGLVANRMRR
ncbi:polysaccharide biosynthesis tyrosine autokinase [Limnoraphis robusta]|uniref:Polysaccharide biosynthesis tyrosine autokinase n=1 Tax=Limnoraphis robusta CCNP1315 TaxID=3110306 RepID=A0ABU5TYZ7_9CYAN|nr:polysaccharide biosynthesis tyrosine autokinase [Limnoraphis robusta]MEA5519133.1 polysaccharide biosynthesis tyrosine autokinase [Limnoraphis robusta CCNP1315]MEA5548116.1 polysaccharide biosynthesis tyrosine autokinase [Limnoraphis robusta CCNP1324]